MSTFTGILLDVSGSMKNSINDGVDGVDEERGTWVRSIFTVIDDLVKHDISNTNRVFAVGFGGESQDTSIFDILGTLQEVQSMLQSGGRIRPLSGGDPASHETIEEAFKILESNGARTIRKWARKAIVSEAVSENDAQVILRNLRSNKSFTTKFVAECLPSACRNWVDEEGLRRSRGAGGAVAGLAMGAAAFIPGGPLLLAGAVAVSAMTVAQPDVAQGAVASVVGASRQATVQDVKEAVQKGLSYLVQLKCVSWRSVFSVQNAADIIHGCIDEREPRRELTTERAQELLKIVEPYIYGGTPLYSALKTASELLSETVNTPPNHHRLLFVLSDGQPADRGNIHQIQRQLRDINVTVVGCYICNSSKVDPRRLYSKADEDWEVGAKFLFNLSSKIPTEMVPRAIFIKQGWQIDVTNNETRLFMHVNHPDNLKDVCDLARNSVCCPDTLSDLLVSVDLDILINQKNSSIKAHEQVGGTCYANASAAVLYLSMHRILGRDNGYPDFDELRDDLVNRYGTDGANTLSTLEEVCPLYRLHCKEVDVNGAMEAIVAKRPVVARFRLTADEWDKFGRFYKKTPTGVMSKRDLDISSRAAHAETGGHAVVLTSFNSGCLRLMNSWGDRWADNGFFRVENYDVLGLKFIDVYWTLNDLSDREQEYHRKHGSEVAEKLVKKLKALQVATFKCILCNRTSNVTEFTGTWSRVKCPRCTGEFSCNDGDGNILALNMYLTMLSR